MYVCVCVGGCLVFFILKFITLLAVKHHNYIFLRVFSGVAFSFSYKWTMFFKVFFLWTILFNRCVYWCVAVFGREMVCNNNCAPSGKCTAWVNWQWVSFACSCTIQWNSGSLLAAQLLSVFAQDWTSSEVKKDGQGLQRHEHVWPVSRKLSGHPFGPSVCENLGMGQWTG